MITAPRVEGKAPVRDGRVLGYAEFGPPSGRPVVWLHGTPGGRRQVPQAARKLAEDLGARIIGIERPGIGWSTAHLYKNILDFTKDLSMALDFLKVDRLSVIGLSGGGPYSLAAPVGLESQRVVSVGILGGVGPTRGAQAVTGGPISIARKLAPALRVLEFPLTGLLTSLAWSLRPLASPGFDTYAKFSPEGDRKVFEVPEIKEMFLDDLLLASKSGMRAPIDDLILFTRPWGFSLSDVKVPVKWWHGDADTIVPLSQAKETVSHLANCDLIIRPGESHLGGMGAADEVIRTLLKTWDDN